MQNVLIILAYEGLAFLFVCGLIQRIGQDKMMESQFDGYYFLKWSVSSAAAIQIAFIVLSSILYHDQQAIAVGLAALPGIMGFFIVTMAIQAAFFRRYNSLVFVIRRLEALTPFEREIVLSQLPPKTFAQLPGDYRFVSYHTGSSR